jgi:hypothetical protein
MFLYNISGGNQGAVGDNAKAEQFIQHDNRQLVLTAEDLSVLMQELSWSPGLRQVTK